MSAISVSSILPTVSLPDMGRFTLPGGTKVDLRGLDKTAEAALNNTAEVMVATLLALLIVGVGWMISNKIAGYTQRALLKFNAEATFAAFIGSLARYILFFTSVVLALNLLGISHSSAVVIFGAAGLATAFALRGTVSHLAAGVMLMANRPFKVGDYIELVEGTLHPQGKVKRITLFNTEINTLTHERLFLPNSKVWESTIINHSYNELRLVALSIPILPDTDLNKVRKAVLPILQADKHALNRPEPMIGYEGFDEKFTALKLYVGVWVRTRDYDEAKFMLLGPVLEALAKAKIKVSTSTSNQFPRRFND
jgi:small conductance mechanosensitive channel